MSGIKRNVLSTVDVSRICALNLDDLLTVTQSIPFFSGHTVYSIFESSHRDLLTKYLFDKGYLPGKCLSVRGIGVSWKIITV